MDPEHVTSGKIQKVKLFENATPPNSTIFVLGSTGSGKSTLMANLLLERDRFIILDVKDEYEIEFFEQPGKKDAVIVGDLASLVGALNDGKKRIIFRVSNDSFTDDLVNNASFILIDFMKANPGLEITFSIDELNRFVSINKVPQGLQEITQRGRAYGIKKIFGAQWFNSIPPSIRDSFSEIYVYRHSDVRGYANLAIFGFDPEEVKRLPDFTVLHSKNGAIERIRLQGEE